MSLSIAKDVRMFIVENFLFGDETLGIPEDGSLIDLGIIDSTGVLELVSFLEERFGIQVKDADIVPDNLDSIAKITRYVDSQMAVATAV